MSEFDSLQGRIFIGLVISAILYGIGVLQAFLYYRNYPKDGWQIKTMVAVIMFFDTLQMVLSTIAMYQYLITTIGKTGSDLDILFEATWPLNLQTDCNGVIGLIVECFFARRVYILSRNHILASLIVTLSSIHFGLGIVYTVGSFRLKSTSKFGQLIWVTSAGLGSAAAADIIIATSLCYYLLKSRTGFSRTDSLIRVLMVYSLTTGLATGLLATITVVWFAVKGGDYGWEAVFWVLGKVYVNSILATLNSREFLRERVAPIDNTFLQLSGFQGTIHPSLSRPTRQTQSHSNHSDPVVVTVGTSPEQMAFPPEQFTISVSKTTVSRTDYCESPDTIVAPIEDGRPPFP